MQLNTEIIESQVLPIPGFLYLLNRALKPGDNHVLDRFCGTAENGNRSAPESMPQTVALWNCDLQWALEGTIAVLHYSVGDGI